MSNGRPIPGGTGDGPLLMGLPIGMTIGDGARLGGLMGVGAIGEP